MFRRVMLLSALLLLIAFPLCEAAAKSYTAEHFDVDWNLTESGVLEVTETVVFRFEGGPFTYVYRELPADYSDGIEGIAASLDGEPLPQGSQAGQFEIEGNSPIKVTWHFPPTTDTTHTFQLKYRVLGVIRQAEGADLFWWNALPTDYEYPIASSTVRLTYPPNLQPSGSPEVRRGTAQINQGDGEVTWTAQNLGPNTPLTVAVPFPAGSIIVTPPEWQARTASARAAMPGFLAVAGLALVAGFVWLWALWARVRRSETAVGQVAGRTSTLPDPLPPALAGALGGANGRPNATHALGALFDLAQRGVLTIEESPDKRWYKGREFNVRLLAPTPGDLRPHEQGLLALAFTDKKGPTDTIKMSGMGTRLARQLKLFAAPLTAELNAAGLIDPQRRATAKRFAIIGGVLIFLMLPLGAAGPADPR